MSILREIDGVDVSDYLVIELKQSAFAEIDLDLFPPLRTHFLIHAIQFQHSIPSQSSMLRSERRNEKKTIKRDANDLLERHPLKRIIPKQQKRSYFIVPSKYGPQPLKMPPNISVPRLGPGLPGLPIGLPGSPSMPPTLIGMPAMLTRPIIPVMPSAIPGIPQFNPSMVPRFPMPQNPTPSALPGISPMPFNHSMVPRFSMPPLSVPMSASSSINPPSLILNKKKNLKSSKQPNSAFKVKSSEQIVLKSARTACKDKIQNWRKQIKPNISENVVEPIPIYFQKKKANQKRRRLEKHELIKKHKKQLIKIYGAPVFYRGWPISRQEIRQALGLKDQEIQVEFEGVGELMNEENTTEQKIEQKVNSQEQELIPNEPEKATNKQDKQKSELKLVLLKEEEEAASVCLIPQLVYTS